MIDPGGWDYWTRDYPNEDEGWSLTCGTCESRIKSKIKSKTEWAGGEFHSGLLQIGPDYSGLLRILARWILSDLE